MPINATCAAFASILASLPPGETVKLTGTCPAISISRTFAPPMLIDAHNAIVYGLSITGGGIIWRGGTIRASSGENGIARAGYGAFVSGKNVTLEGVRFIDSNRGVVSNGAINLSVRRSQFDLGQDGIIAAGGSDLEISFNNFRMVTSKPMTCLAGSVLINGISARLCKEKQGIWHDGWHQDAIQIRNGIKGIKIIGNKISGVGQGIGEMNAKSDEPLSDVLIENNDVSVSGFHSITIGKNSINVVIKRNVVRQSTGRRTIIRAPDSAVVCDNDVQTLDDPGANSCDRKTIR